MTAAKDRRTVTIVDYGVGNITSLRGALERSGMRTVVSRAPEEIAGAGALVLPGVGAFDFAMANMRRTALDDAIRAAFQSGEATILGICLGMQVLFEHSEEGDVAGLGLLPGRVRAFKGGECHVGWNLTRDRRDNAAAPQAYYFNHSYFVDCPDEVVISKAEFQHPFPARIATRSCHGVQFHPEKSQMVGQALLRGMFRGHRDA